MIRNMTNCLEVTGKLNNRGTKILTEVKKYKVFKFEMFHLKG